MGKSNVAIVSLNKELVRFFELEIKGMNCNVTVLSQGKGNFDGYDIIFLDGDTVKDTNDTYSCPVVVVSSKYDGTPDMFLLPWPTPISMIRKICNHYVYRSDDEQESQKAQKSALNKVYISDRENGIVIIENFRIRLTKTELALLELLCHAGTEAVSREKIMETLGAQDGNISDVYICHLRKKLETPLGKRLIFTERQKGYRTVLQISE